MLDLPRQLRSVNQLLYRSSESSRYATLFLGVYDDVSRQLTVFSDGITEAFGGDGEEFGEHRLLEILRGHRRLSVAALVDEVIRRVAEFGGSEQADDQPLVVARVR
jgi:serine phosphatase RsbU (regulator of sigma subunit)